MDGAGWVTQLDYEASTPTQFNLDFVRARLALYPNKELVSHLVLGVRLLAELDLAGAAATPALHGGERGGSVRRGVAPITTSL